MLKINRSLLTLLILGLAANLNAQEDPEPTEQHEDATAAARSQAPAPSDVPASAIPKLVAAAEEPAATNKPAEENKPAEPATAPVTEQAKPAEAKPVQPEAAQPTPAVEPKASEVAKPAETPAPASAETGKKSQSFEESFGLTPSTPVEAKPIHLPEIAHIEEPKSSEPKAGEQASDFAKATTDRSEMPTTATKTAGSDEETCTVLCKKVCMALKDEDRKILEEEAPTSDFAKATTDMKEEPQTATENSKAEMK